MLRSLHVALAYLTVIGFVLRGVLSFGESALRQQRWYRIAPHVIDTLLLLVGIVLAVQLSISPFEHGWLTAKIAGLIVYIGFGVMAMRATARPMKILGFVLAIATAGYIFAVAYTRQVIPF